MSSLTEFYTILSTNFDRKGYEFISSIEGKQKLIIIIIYHSFLILSYSYTLSILWCSVASGKEHI